MADQAKQLAASASKTAAELSHAAEAKATQLSQAAKEYGAKISNLSATDKAKYVAADLADDGQLNQSVTIEEAQAFNASAATAAVSSGAKSAGAAVAHGAAGLFESLKAFGASALAAAQANPVVAKATDFTAQELTKAKATLDHLKDTAVETYHTTTDAALDKTAALTAQGIRAASPAIEKAKAVGNDLLEQAQPTIAKIQAAAEPTISKIQAAADPLIDRAKEITAPAVAKIQEVSAPAVAKIQEVAAPAVAGAKATVNKVQDLVTEELNKLDTPKNILFVCTSHAKLGSTDKTTGLWLEEVAAPYLVFTKAGNKVTVASVQGGKIPVDEASLADGALTAEAREFQADPDCVKVLEDSVPLDSITDLSQYDAIFLPGGHGTVFDLPKNAKLQEVIAEMFKAGKPVAAVCHGPVGLVNVKVDGKPIVAGKKVTGFSNSEETAVGLTNVVPFLLENKLKDLGGNYSAGADWSPHAVRDGNLITGQNPASSAKTAEEVLKALRA